MEKISLLNKHRPFHFYRGCFYFITGSTLNGVRYFTTEERKNVFIKKFSLLSVNMGIGICSWVLLENHYHCILHLYENETSGGKFVLCEFLRKLHSQTGSILNQNDGMKRRQIWYQYWDHCIRNMTDFWKHFNYIVKNPFKHKIVSSLEDGFKYRFSSNPVWLEKMGEEGLCECFIKYPVAEVFEEE